MSSIEVKMTDFTGGGRLSVFFNNIITLNKINTLSTRIKEKDINNIFTKIQVTQDRSTTNTTQIITTQIILSGVGVVTFHEEIVSIPGISTPDRYTIGIHHRPGEFNGTFTDFVRYMIMLDVHQIISILLNNYISDFETFTEKYDEFCSARTQVDRLARDTMVKYGDKCLPLHGW